MINTVPHRNDVEYVNKLRYKQNSGKLSLEPAHARNALELVQVEPPVDIIKDFNIHLDYRLGDVQ